MIDGNDGGVDITHRRRRDLVRPAAADRASSTTSTSTTACPTASWARMQDLGTASRAEQQPVAAAASRSATGTPSAAARPATPCPIPTDPNIVYAGEYGGYHHALRPPHAAGPQRRRLSRTTPPATAPANCSTASSGRPRSWSRRTTRRSSTTRPTCCSAPATAGRPGRPISPDLTRNDKSKQQWSRRPDHRRQHRRRDLLHHLRRRRVAASRRACSGPAATTAWSTSRATAARPGRT